MLSLLMVSLNVNLALKINMAAEQLLDLPSRTEVCSKQYSQLGIYDIFKKKKKNILHANISTLLHRPEEN